MREASRHLDYGVEDEVEHQRNAAAVTVGHQSKNERAHRTKRQGQRDGESNLFVGAVKLLGNRGQTEDDQKEIESVQRPPEKAGEDRGPVAVFCRWSDWLNGRIRGSAQSSSFCDADTINEFGNDKSLSREFCLLGLRFG